jgi:hypothetical protein
MPLTGQPSSQDRIVAAGGHSSWQGLADDAATLMLAVPNVCCWGFNAVLAFLAPALRERETGDVYNYIAFLSFLSFFFFLLGEGLFLTAFRTARLPAVCRLLQGEGGL